MKTALTIWHGRVSPVFDVSREAIVVTMENGVVRERCTANIEAPTATLKVERLIGLGVGTLICGAISEPLHYELTSRGLKVFAFVAGPIEDVFRAYVAGDLPSPALSMPGCGWQQRSRSCGRRRRARAPKAQG